MTLAIKHKTAEGTVLLIKNMTDSHLINTIKMHLRQAVQVRASAAFSKEMSEYDEGFYEEEFIQLSPKRAGKVVRDILAVTSGYITEMVARGLVSDEITQMLSNALGRTPAEQKDAIDTPLLELPEFD